MFEEELTFQFVVYCYNVIINSDKFGINRICCLFKAEEPLILDDRFFKQEVNVSFQFRQINFKTSDVIF